jgi:hypothetical protein
MQRSKRQSVIRIFCIWANAAWIDALVRGADRARSSGFVVQWGIRATVEELTATLQGRVSSHHGFQRECAKRANSFKIWLSLSEMIDGSTGLISGVNAGVGC